jgi:hypothetical protein
MPDEALPPRAVPVGHVGKPGAQRDPPGAVGRALAGRQIRDDNILQPKPARGLDRSIAMIFGHIEVEMAAFGDEPMRLQQAPRTCRVFVKRAKSLDIRVTQAGYDGQAVLDWRKPSRAVQLHAERMLRRHGLSFSVLFYRPVTPSSRALRIRAYDPSADCRAARVLRRRETRRLPTRTANRRGTRSGHLSAFQYS